MNVNVGAPIRRERQRQGLSLRELARRVGVSASMLSQVETDRTRPSVSTIYAIATELGISIDALLSDRDAAGLDAADAGAVTEGGGVASAVNADTGTTGSRRGPSLGELGCQLVSPENRRKLELEIVAEVTRLKQAYPNLGLAHRKLSAVTDDDLRSMIEDIYWSVEHAS